MASVPRGAQNLLEWLVEGLYNLLESIIGRHLVEKTFWFFATIFIFILAANWLSLVPGVGTIGWGHQTAHGFTVDRPLLRGANADLNLTLAMSLVFFGCWIVWAIQEVGVGGMAKELFAPKGETAGALRILMIVVFAAAGLLEGKKIAGMAETHYAQIAPHLYCGPVEGAANIQLAACSPNFLILESIQTWGGFHAEILKVPIVWQDGYVIPPAGPGLGVELDEKVAARHPYDGSELHLEMQGRPL